MNNRIIKRIANKGKVVSVLLLALFALPVNAQTAKQVLDKAAAVSMNASGTIAIKDKKFHATTAQATIWFDGKTQWTYMKKNDEVNVAHPDDSQLQAINPYNFIYMYKKGYSSTMTKKGGSYEVHLKADSKKSGIQEMYIVVNQKTSVPSQVRMKQQKGWTTIDISNFKQAKLSDSTFRFNSKDFPDAEIIDLR